MNRVSQTDRISNKNQVHSYRLSSVIIMMDSDIGVKKSKIRFFLMLKPNK